MQTWRRRDFTTRAYCRSGSCGRGGVPSEKLARVSKALYHCSRGDKARKSNVPNGSRKRNYEVSWHVSGNTRRVFTPHLSTFFRREYGAYVDANEAVKFNPKLCEAYECKARALVAMGCIKRAKTTLNVLRKVDASYEVGPRLLEAVRRKACHFSRRFPWAFLNA